MSTETENLNTTMPAHRSWVARIVLGALGFLGDALRELVVFLLSVVGVILDKIKWIGALGAICLMVVMWAGRESNAEAFWQIAWTLGFLLLAFLVMRVFWSIVNAIRR